MFSGCRRSHSKFDRSPFLASETPTIQNECFTFRAIIISEEWIFFFFWKRKVDLDINGRALLEREASGV